ncbi:histidine phosphatase family protein [Halodurantibacterium flavum]|uniref:Histidine phosphatase family protein n=1 Tax=Halodurantibacterium flavum TaxID=1382802 RepID=A0ABW4S0Y5_9RHOB
MIFLLRHGQTEYNVEGRYQGAKDSPLTRLGQQQANVNGKLLSLYAPSAQLWCSPLPRAVETARLISAYLPTAHLRLEPRLREVSLGQWEGLTRAAVKREWPELRKAHPHREWLFHAPGGERLESVTVRLRGVLEDAAAMSDKHAVVLVSHSIVGRVLRGLHAGLPLSRALTLEAPQDVVLRLEPGGVISELMPPQIQ